MTSTVTIDFKTTKTLTVSETKTLIIQGIQELQLNIIDTMTDDSGITLINKQSNPSSTISTFTTKVTSSSTLSSSSSTAVVSLFKTTSSSTSNKNIGLIIGIPIGIIGLILFSFCIWFYFKRKQNKLNSTDEILRDHYDENYNYKISPNNVEFSPYKFKSNTTNSSFTINNNEKNSDEDKNNIVRMSLNEPEVLPKSNWNLNTPLSKWFISKHNNLNDSSRSSLSTGPRSPMIVLKEFKLKNLNFDRNILPTFPDQVYKTDNNESNDIISRQTVKQEYKSIPIKLNPIPLNKKTNNKPLPRVPYLLSSKSQLEGLEQKIAPIIYKVVKPYDKNLADEVSIFQNEYVKILSSHTDGWCLIEKCNRYGEIHSNNATYINENRGVVPEKCLEKLQI